MARNIARWGCVLSLHALLVQAAIPVIVNGDGSYSVASWPNSFVLESGPTALRADGKWLSTSDSSLVLHGAALSVLGVDVWGSYNETRFDWAASSSPTTGLMRTAVRVYDVLPAVVFETTFLSSITTGGGDRENVSCSFPTFKIVPNQSPAGWIQYHGAFINDGYNGPTFGHFNSTAGLISGLKGGPIVVFDQSGSNTYVLSAASDFMAQSTVVFGEALHTGALGSAAVIPSGWSYSSMIYLGLGSGINPTVMAWGAALMSRYGKTRALQQSDVTSSTLTYNTDHGVYYYYLTEKGKDYLDTLLDVHAYAISAGIPYKVKTRLDAHVLAPVLHGVRLASTAESLPTVVRLEMPSIRLCFSTAGGTTKASATE